MISFDEFLVLCDGMLFWPLLVFDLHELHELSSIELQRKASHNFIAQHTTSFRTYQIRISTCAGMPLPSPFTTVSITLPHTAASTAGRVNTFEFQ